MSKLCLNLFSIFIIAACSFKQDERTIDPVLLPGKYCDNIDGRDSIFIYVDKTYKHTYHHADGTISKQTHSWRCDSTYIFFDGFTFFNDGGPGKEGYFYGTWSPKVLVTEDGKVKFQYSESVFYIKKPEK